jgi:anti-anti-sigma factor
MNLTTERANGVAVVRIGESRLMYPLLSEFSSAVTQLIASGERRVVVDLSSVGYVDSATIGCLMDLYRQASAAGGALKLAGVQKRVETMLTMTGAQMPLDGDLLTILEALYHEMTAKQELERTFEDTVREIQHVIDQMSDEERRQYLSESLFLNFVSYENERLGAYMKKLVKKA